MSSCLKSFKQIIEKFKLTKRPQASEDAGLPPSDLTNLPVNNTPELVAALEQVSLRFLILKHGIYLKALLSSA